MSNLTVRNPWGLHSWVGYTSVGFNFRYPPGSHDREPKRKTNKQTHTSWFWQWEEKSTL